MYDSVPLAQNPSLLLRTRFSAAAGAAANFNYLMPLLLNLRHCRFNNKLKKCENSKRNALNE